MLTVRNSIARKLTALNLIGSAVALLLASTAFFAYDLSKAREAMLSNLAVQAQIVGYNSVTPLVFNDAQSAQKTLAAMRASPDITYAGIYTPDGKFFAGYWRGGVSARNPLPLISPTQIRNRLFVDSEFSIVQPIMFGGKLVGTVYIRSDAQPLIQRAEGYLAILIGILIVSLTATFLVSRISQHIISAPIIELAETARIVSGDKNYAVRAKLNRNSDEIGVLVSSFNEMLSEIQSRDIALRESERQFRTLADSVPQLAWMAEPDGYIFWYNRRWYEYTGTTPEEMAGWGWQSVHDPNILPQVMERWTNAIKTRQRFEMVFPLRGRDGEFRDFLTLVEPVYDAGGKVVRWFGTNTDITEQRRSEEALRRSEKLAATGRLAASIAHEINNPLEAVTNLLYLARKHPAAADKHLSMADQELDRIAEITRHTLGFYRDSSTAMRLNISEVLEDVFRLYDRKLKFKHIIVRKRYAPDVEVSGFPGEIRQIFANLAANAIEALGDRGMLTIKASRAHEWTKPYRSGVRVSVIDNGSGIRPEQMKDIFEPFYTTKKNTGTGLGLWLAQNLVKKHSGSIKVRSRVGSSRTGTVFSIFLPDADAGGENSSADAAGHSGGQVQ